MIVEDEVYRAAKDAAREAGMMLKSWVSKAITEKAARERPAEQKERKYERVED